MPHVVAQVPNLHHEGPVLEVQIYPSRPAIEVWREQDHALPPPVKVKAMIDTGATNTVIRQGIASDLGLNPIGEVKINTPSSVGVPCYQYFVRLAFPNNIIFETVVIEAPLRGQNIQCLIGRNVLVHATFIYMGPVNLFSLHI